MPNWYVLDENGEPRYERDFLKAAIAFEDMAARTIGCDEIDGVLVSTIFLGIDHCYTPGGRPVLFETMVFGGGHSESQQRYHTRAEAEAGHKHWVAYIKSGARPDWLKGFSRN